MRIVRLLAIGLAGGALSAAGVRAEHAPVLVIPGRPDVPVIINGYDASFTVVEGDWGLSRPGHMPPAIVSGPLIRPSPYYRGGYFPSQGRRPGYGRYEVEPPAGRRLPRAAPSYYREWGIQSQKLPADVPANQPPLIPAAPYDAAGESGADPSNTGAAPDRRAGTAHGRDRSGRAQRPRHHKRDRHAREGRPR